MKSNGKRLPNTDASSEPSSSKVLKCASDDANKTNTVLHQAIEQNNKLLIEELLGPKWNIDVNAQNSAGATPLHVAAAKRYDDYIHLLLGKQANSNIRDNENRTFIDIIRNDGILKGKQLAAAAKSASKFKSGKANSLSTSRHVHYT